VVDVGSWRLIFFINVPLIAVTLVMARAGMAQHIGDRSRKVDIGGAVMAMVGLGSLTYGLIQGPVTRWAPVEVAAIVIGIILMLGFGWYESRQADPMLKLDLFKSRNFLAANITTFAMYGGLGGFLFSLAIYLQTTAGYTTLQAGASLLPITIILFLVSPRAGKWAGTHGPRGLMTIGPILAGAGIGMLAFMGKSAPYFTSVMPGVAVFAFGLALTVAPLTATVMGSVSNGESGIASGVNNAVSRVAGLFVIGLLGLFGAANSYRFAAILCASLAALAGVMSYLMINDSQIVQRGAEEPT